MRKYVFWVFTSLAAGAFVQCATDYGGAQSTTTTTSTAGGGVYATTATAPPLPLDPLRPEEIEAAQRIARADPRVAELLGERARVIYTHSTAPKLRANDDEPRGRYADVLFISGNQEVGVRVLVDLTARRVVEHIRLPQNRVPLGPGDIEEALSIAVQHQAVQQLLGARARNFRVLTGSIGPHNANADFVEGLQHIGGSPEDPCFTHRCVVLLFNSGGQLIVTDQEILVDLNTRQVRVTSLRQGGDR